MSQDRRNDRHRPAPPAEEPEGDTTMELSIRDVLNIQSHDHKQDARRPVGPTSVSGSSQTQPVRTQSAPARAAYADDDDDDDNASTSVVIPDARLLAAASGKPINEPTAEVRLDAALLATIRRTEEISAEDNETTTFSIPRDLLQLSAQGTPSAQRTIPMPSIRGPITEELPSGAITPLTSHDPEDERQTLPAGRAPIEAIATIDAQGRLIVPIPVLDAAGLRPGQRLKIIGYIIE